jgi:hypothetical protein
MRPADFGSFVPIESQPTEAVQDRRQGVVQVANLVRIVNSQQELAAVPSGKQPVEQRRSDAANV